PASNVRALPAQPAPATALPAAKKPGTLTHRVVAGDTVWALAKTYRSSVPAIITANDLSPSALIRIGQQLTIPAGRSPAAKPSAPKKPAASTSTKARTHKVVSGDTVGALAVRYSSTVGAIVKANRLNAAALIYVGQTLTIPGSGQAAG